MKMFKRLIIFLPLVLAGVSRADIWRLSDVKWNGLTDSVRLNSYQDGTLMWTLKKGVVQKWDTTLQVSAGHIYQMNYLIYFQGDSFPATWSFTRETISPGGSSYPWHLADVDFGGVVDSVQLRYYADTVTIRGSSVGKKTGVSGYDTTLTGYVGKYNTANFLIWYPGMDSATTWSWVWDLTDTSTTGQVTTPTNPNRSYVHGKIIKNDGSIDEIRGAIVEATRTSGTNAAANAFGVHITIAGLPTYATVDRQGVWGMYLVGTHEFTADTTRGFYNIKCTTRNGTQLFNLEKVWVPSSGDLNLSDTLNARTQ